MPFPNQIPLPFNRAQIELLHPGQCGCYGLFVPAQNCYAYIGKAYDLRERLLCHLGGDNASINSARPTHFATVKCDRLALDELEKQLICEYTPFCNQRIG